MGMLRNQYFPFEFPGIEDDSEAYTMYVNLKIPGFQIDLEILEYNSISINYTQVG